MDVNSLHRAFEEAIGNGLRSSPEYGALLDSGWQYRDPRGRFSPEMWDHFLSVLGDGEYRLIAGSNGVDSDGLPWVRGQLLVSPRGLANATAHLKASSSPAPSQEPTKAEPEASA